MALFGVPSPLCASEIIAKICKSTWGPIDAICSKSMLFFFFFSPLVNKQISVIHIYLDLWTPSNITQIIHVYVYFKHVKKIVRILYQLKAA